MAKHYFDGMGGLLHIDGLWSKRGGEVLFCKMWRERTAQPDSLKKAVKEVITKSKSSGH